MAERRLRASLGAGLLAAALLLVGCGGGPSEDDVSGAVLTEPYDVPDTALTDTGGAPFSMTEDTDRRLTLVFFGYTNCPDICQTVMANVANALQRLDDADRQEVEVVFVTTDPARDDEQVIRTWLDRFDSSFVGLTGELGTITDLGNDLGVAVEKGTKLPSGGYEVTHSTQVIGIDGNDRAPIVWTEGTSASEFASDIHLLLGDA